MTILVDGPPTGGACGGLALQRWMAGAVGFGLRRAAARARGTLLRALLALLASLLPLSDAAADDPPGLTTTTNACMVWFKGAFPGGPGFFYLTDVPDAQFARYVYVGSGGSTGAPAIPGPAIFWLPNGSMEKVDWLLNLTTLDPNARPPCRIILEFLPEIFGNPPRGASPFPKGL